MYRSRRSPPRQFLVSVKPEDGHITAGLEVVDESARAAWRKVYMGNGRRLARSFGRDNSSRRRVRCGRSAYISKEEEPNVEVLLKYRVITILPAVYMVWSNMRYRHSADWAE